MHKLWLSGERYNVDYLFDISTGEVLQKVVLPAMGGQTAGNGRYCGKRFVAFYVAPDRTGVVLQIDAYRFLLDGQTTAKHRWRLGGTISSLLVSRPGHRDVTVTQVLLKSLIAGILDPTYDGLDMLNDDFLWHVSLIVNSNESSQWILAHKDPEAGPWEYEQRSVDDS